MNRIVELPDLPNQSLLLSYNGADRHVEKDMYYTEIVRRVLEWGVLTGQSTHMPRSVVVDIFRRHMRLRDSDANDVYIPEDRKEIGDYPEVDWFIGEDEDEDLFKI